MISVLYVDDEQGLLDLCKIFLERTGELQIHTEISARKALNRLSHESFDAIISDYQMPDINGIEFLKQVRGSGSTIPFIVFTGRGREEVAIEALKEGADFYLQKGGDPTTQFVELINQIKQIVRQRKAESAVRESEQMYRALFQSAHDAIILIHEDRIVDSNLQMEALFGMRRDDLIGCTLIDLSPPFQPDGSLSAAHVHSRIAAALSGDPQFFEIKLMKCNKTPFDAEMSLNIIDINHRSLLLVIIRDISRRKHDETELSRKNEEIATSYEELLSAEEELREQFLVISKNEKKIRESEEKLRSILASMDDLVLTIDSQGAFQDYFKRSPEHYYIKPEEFAGRPFYDVLPPDMSTLLHNAMEKVKKTGRTEQIEYSLPFPEGTKHYSARISQRLSDTGEFDGITLVARDNTLQKKADAALIRQEAKLNAIIQGSPIPQFIIDVNHRIIHWNTALAVYSGIAAEKVIGTDQHWRAFYPNKRPCLADILIDGTSDTLPEWYGGKYQKSSLIPDAYTAYDFFPHMGTDGVWLSFTAAIIRDHTGEIIGAVETLVDITEQKRSAISLEEKESRYRGIIEDMQDMFYKSDLKGNLIMASPSFSSLLGYDSLEECIGKNVAETFFVHPEDRDILVALILKEGSISNYQVNLKRRDGTSLFVSANSHVFYGPDGKPAGIEGVLRDITGLKVAEAKLEYEETILNAVIDESPVPLFMIDRNHLVIHWNKALEKYSGIPADTVKGTNQHWRAFYPSERPCMADLLVEEDIDHLSQWYQGKYAQSRLIDGAFEAVDFFPDIGEKGCWLYFTGAPIRGSDGTLIGAVEILEDITEQKVAEFEIHRMSQFLESIIMNANVWIMVLDRSGKIIVWNHAAEEISGYQADEVSGRSQIWKALYPDPAYRHTITGNISRIIAENRYLQDFQTTIRTKSGDLKDILWNTRGIQGREHPDRFVAIGIDITPRILAEQALHKSEATLKAIVKGSPIPMFVIDKIHRVIQWNTALVKYSGIPVDEIMGTDQHWRAFYPEKRSCIADILVDGDEESLKDLHLHQYEQSSLIEGGYLAIEFLPRMGLDDSWFSITAAPVHDEEGRVIGAIETREDITQQKNAERNLIESEERFRTLFENASDAIFLYGITRDGVPDLFIEVNETACRRLGYSREELLKMSPKDIKIEYSTEKERDFINQLRKEGHATFEAVHITRNQDEIPVEMSTHIYEFRGEKVLLSIARDISDRKRFESAIQNANKKLNLLSSITRHDILNQLTSLSGYLDLSEEVTDSEELLEFIRKEKRAADTILRHILFTRDYQTIGIQSPKWQNLKTTILRATGLLELGSVTLQVHFDDIDVFADPLLEKVFFNLIDNSVRYGNGLTKIDFSIEFTFSGITLICSDDGGGIPPAEKENIFNRKYFRNTGFGLFLSREILAITGLVIAETGEYGVGARFEIIIPKGSFRGNPD
jgi:PAS domain S-box-containing protein